MLSQTESPRQNGYSIRAIRKREGLSVDKLAELVTKSGLSLSAPHLRNIENEHKNASIEYLAAIARVLDVPIDALRRGREDAA